MRRRFECHVPRGRFLLGLILSLVTVIVGLLVLPEIGIWGVENLFSLVWTTLGMLIILGFLLGLVRAEAREKLLRCSRRISEVPEEQRRRRYGSSS